MLQRHGSFLPALHRISSPRSSSRPHSELFIRRLARVYSLSFTSFRGQPTSKSYRNSEEASILHTPPPYVDWVTLTFVMQR
ncbi:hypothetical protein F2P81_024931 [Scophthalmus maximus]|uniref:Uncharacterized protein n=1 Tax=Scophthalmus maximus TaxID=52904 RepID=A0A6A4RUA0_SCOMX|nr:hypothetical protein F2P81_024931 [Scophthalmus maximus]